MTAHTYHGPDMVQKIRDALPRVNPWVQRQVKTFKGVRRHIDTVNLRLKGVATGKDGLVFTFSDGDRRILEKGQEISITNKRITFTDIEGDEIVIIFK